MTVLRIREVSGLPGGANAELSVDNADTYPITITDPFAEAEEARLAWYFEEWLRFPFTKQWRASNAAKSTIAYGEALFGQVFAHRQAYVQYSQADLTTLRLEIVGSPEFHRLHWEALKDPGLPQPLALRATLVRKNLNPPPFHAAVLDSPTLNLLIVTARPQGAQDVSYRTISRPLVEALQQAKTPVRVDILRPGTFQALTQHLEETTERQGSGYYHLIHFDVHGGLLQYDNWHAGVQANRYAYQSRYGREEITPYEGLRAFLSLEGEQPGQADLVEASELAKRLLFHQIPIVVLNACQSGKQVGAIETSLGGHLMRAGVQMVLAMGYSITVSAAQRLMQALYPSLFTGNPLAVAIRRGRQELYNQKTRRAYYNQQVDLEDWLLPVVYENQDSPLAIRPFTPAEAKVWYERQATRFSPPKPTYGFVGRDLDVLQIERRLLNHNLLLVRGMGGAGKTTLLRHLGAWWQTTHFIDQVFEFGYDVRAWTREQILEAIAQQVFDKVQYYGTFQPLSLAAQQQMLAAQLNSHRHLLMLDNLESITGRQLAIRHTLPETEQDVLREFLACLAGGQTLVLLGSRGAEAWLAPGTFNDNVYELPGLDPEAASDLANSILERYGVTRYRTEAAFRELLKRLDGYPLPLEVVLANLARQTPATVLEALKAGEVVLDSGSAQDKTHSILHCIEYSHSNLAPEAQSLLNCLAPFTGVIYTRLLPHYTECLKEQSALAPLPFDRWAEVLQEAVNWGLLSPHPDFPGWLRLQPVLPYFLRARLQAQAEMRQAIHAAFRQCYEATAHEIRQLLKSQAPDERQRGQVIAGLEYENLTTALELALSAQASIWNPYFALSNYLDTTHEEARGLALGERVLKPLEQYSADTLAGPLGAELAGVIHNIGNRQLNLKQYQAAERTYQRALTLWQANKSQDTSGIKKGSALIYHQLGMVAEEQRQWAQAEEYYQQALALKIEFNARDEQAGTYYQLGRVAQEQHQWAQAEDYYQKALALYIEFNDRYKQAYAYHALGSVAQEQRQWAQAEAYYQQALALKIEFNARYWQASTYHQLGVVAEEQRQWAQAEAYYQQALALKIEFNARYEQAGTYHQLGMVAEEQRQWAQALDCFLKALALFREYQDEEGTRITLGSLARLWQATHELTVPAAVAAVMEVPVNEIEERLRKLLNEE